MRGPWIQPPSIACCKRDVVEVGRADVAHGGEAGVERLLGIGDADRGPEAVGVFEALIAADLGQAGQVDVHVDQAGKQGLAGQVDMLDAGRRSAPCAASAMRLDPAIVADEDRRMLDISAGA